MLKLEKTQCSGCGACVNICPTGAVTMEYDSEGFPYPAVDPARCVGCGKCEQHCPCLKEKKQPDAATPRVWAVQAKDRDRRLNSSSGGLFLTAARYVIGCGGVVFGAAFTDSFELRHVEADCPEDLERLSGSKYLQSDIGLTYRKIGQYLKQGRPVLFSGTPCQVAGLKAFLARPYENLICTDFICHGVPSPRYWGQYVQYRANCAGSPPAAISFRDKARGWHEFSVRFRFENGSEYSACHRQDPYMQLFLQDVDLRPSCYQCRFRTENRVSDLTMADFWAVRHFCPELDDDTGVSLAIVHSQQGEALLRALEDRLICRKIPFQAVLRGNGAMLRSPACPKSRKRFFEEKDLLTPPEAAKKFARPGLKQTAASTVRSVLRAMSSKIK